MTSHRAKGPSPLLETGTRIADRYVVVRSLGEGGMGQVFEVEHEAIGRHFALKVLNISPCTDETLRRFRREARALGRITTPRVAQVTDFDYEPGVGPFYIMELLDGETLEHRLEREHHLPAHIAIPVAIDLCEALNEVHSLRIIHRDLKPSNVGLVRIGPMRIKLLDFGLAAAADAAVLERITRSQEVVGSLPYMAPERFYNAPLTFSIDLYALGVVLYEMLTGGLPFQGTSAAVLINQHLNEAPPPFSEVAPGLQIPASLEAIVVRLLDKDPDQRFTSAVAVSRALQAAAIDVTTPTLADESEPAPTGLTESSESNAVVNGFKDQSPGDHQDHIVTIDAPPEPFDGAADEDDLLGGPTEMNERHPALLGGRTGAAAGIPTSVVPGSATTPSTWPRPIEPPRSSEHDHDRQPPATFAQLGTPPAEISNDSWGSGSVAPTTFEPSDVFDTGVKSRQWLKITAVLAAGVIGSTLAAVLAFILLLDSDDGRGGEPDSPSSVIQPHSGDSTQPESSGGSSSGDHGVSEPAEGPQKNQGIQTPSPPSPRPQHSSTKTSHGPHRGSVKSPSGLPLDTPDAGAPPPPVKPPAKGLQRREPHEEPPPPAKTSVTWPRTDRPPARPWRGEIITVPE